MCPVTNLLAPGMWASLNVELCTSIHVTFVLWSVYKFQCVFLLLPLNIFNKFCQSFSISIIYFHSVVICQSVSCSLLIIYTFVCEQSSGQWIITPHCTQHTPRGGGLQLELMVFVVYPYLNHEVQRCYIKNTSKTPYSSHSLDPCLCYTSVLAVLYLTHWGHDKMAATLADDTSKYKFVNEEVSVSAKNSLKFDLRRAINNIPSLVQIMAWCKPGDKSLSEPMMA